MDLFYDLSKFDNTSGREFEEFVIELFKKLQYLLNTFWFNKSLSVSNFDYSLF